MDVRAILRRIKNETGLNQKQLAEQMGASRFMFQNWIRNGTIPKIRVATLSKITGLPKSVFYDGDLPDRVEITLDRELFAKVQALADSDMTDVDQEIDSLIYKALPKKFKKK